MVVAVALAITGPNLIHLYNANIVTCGARGNCEAATATFLRNDRTLRTWLGVLVIVVPGIIGLFAKVTVFSAAVDAGLGWLAVVMAVNVVVALFYYLQWTALLFRAPEGEQDKHRVPAPLTAALALTGALGIVLSGAPQLVLRFAGTGLF